MEEVEEEEKEETDQIECETHLFFVAARKVGIFLRENEFYN